MNNLNSKHQSIVRLIRPSFESGYILGAIVFGSSLFNKHSKDIDLAIITTRENFDKFISQKGLSKKLQKYDISLIKEEELTKEFYFGGHGQHLVESIRIGKLLVGINPFQKYPRTKIKEIKRSSKERMREYIYTLRKSYFNKDAEEKFYSRYEKILKLAAFLLIDGLKFPAVLQMSIKDINSILYANKYFTNDNKKQNIEYLWSKINV